MGCMAHGTSSCSMGCWHAQDLEQQLRQQLAGGAESVRVLELQSERKLAEERIAELESQLAAAPLPAALGMTPTPAHAAGSAACFIM